MKPPLSARLRAVARLVPSGRPVADIGTGDARLAIFLVREGISPLVVATEASPRGLAVARGRLAAVGLAERVQLRLGWGLEPLTPGEVPVVVLAGLGGNSIREVLGRRPAGWGGSRFILQPMDHAADLRRCLLAQGWCLAEEDLAGEGRRFYQILVAQAPSEPGPAQHPAASGEEPACPPMTEEQRVRAVLAGLLGTLGAEPAFTSGEIGPLLWRRRHPLLAEFIRYRLEKHKQALARAGEARPPGLVELVASLRRLADGLGG